MYGLTAHNTQYPTISCIGQEIDNMIYFFLYFSTITGKTEKNLYKRCLFLQVSIKLNTFCL